MEGVDIQSHAPHADMATVSAMFEGCPFLGSLSEEARAAIMGTMVEMDLESIKAMHQRATPEVAESISQQLFETPTASETLTKTPDPELHRKSMSEEKTAISAETEPTSTDVVVPPERLVIADMHVLVRMNLKAAMKAQRLARRAHEAMEAAKMKKAATTYERIQKPQPENSKPVAVQAVRKATATKPKVKTIAVAKQPLKRVVEQPTKITVAKPSPQKPVLKTASQAAQKNEVKKEVPVKRVEAKPATKQPTKGNVFLRKAAKSSAKPPLQESISVQEVKQKPQLVLAALATIKSLILPNKEQLVSRPPAEVTEATILPFPEFQHQLVEMDSQTVSDAPPESQKEPETNALPDAVVELAVRVMHVERSLEKPVEGAQRADLEVELVEVEHELAVVAEVILQNQGYDSPTEKQVERLVASLRAVVQVSETHDGRFEYWIDKSGHEELNNLISSSRLVVAHSLKQLLGRLAVYLPTAA